MKLSKIVKLASTGNGRMKIAFAAVTKIGRVLSDKAYLKVIYRLNMHQKLNLKHPKTFNEKLQWLKLYNRKPEFTMMVDKYEVKDYVASIIGQEHIIPTLAVYDRAEDIDFDALPNQFVLKCTHDSGDLIICKDKSKLDFEDARRRLAKGLKRDFYKIGREWPYKNVKRRIIVEKYMVDESNEELKDYKVFVFGGKPRFIQVDFGRFTNHRRNIYDTEWNLLDMQIEYPSDPGHVIAKPAKLDEMLKMSSKLSKDIPIIRVDFYSIGEELFFGEITFFHECGYGKFYPKEWDEAWGNEIDLDKGGG